MCGIFGIVNKDGRPVEEELLLAATRTLSHRGPDGEGYYRHENVGLGHRRLSIVDLAGGRQPLANESGEVYLTFNGEIYNHLELRRELEEKGHRFRTRADTEVIVHLYEEYGDDCVDRLRGMFAFALLDLRRRRIVLARDRLGIKPLYLYETPDRFTFASEIKAILRDPAISPELDPIGVSWFLSLHYIPAPRTIYRGIEKVRPATVVSLDLGSSAGPAPTSSPIRSKARRYWRPIHAPDPSLTEEGAREELLAALDDSVAARLMADVPLGAFLSGGIDSGAVVSSMIRSSSTRVRTFTIGFENSSFDESESARAASVHLDTQHTAQSVDSSLLEELPRIVSLLDEPLADPSLLATWQVSRLARERVKVCLSGDGGDELFSGYRRHARAASMAWHRRLALDRLSSPVAFLARSLIPDGIRGKNYLAGLSLPPVRRYLHGLRYFDDRGLSRLLHPGFRSEAALSEGVGGSPDLDPLDRVFLDHDREIGPEDLGVRLPGLDLRTYLIDDVLLKVDRASMMNSLEVRVPLLDHHFVELALRLPASFSRKGKEGKRIFRRALAKRLPTEILQGKKRGFAVPVKSWLKGPLREPVRDLLLDPVTRQNGLFCPREIERLLDENRSPYREHGSRLFGLYLFELWRRRHLKVAPSPSLSPVISDRGRALAPGQWYP